MGTVMTLLACMIFPTAVAASTGKLSRLDQHLKMTASWYFETFSQEVPVKVYHGGEVIGPQGAQAIAYLMNDAWERIGQESDLSILTDYIEKDFIVITLDFGKNELAVSPVFDSDLWAFFRAVYGFRTDSLLAGTGLVPREYRCFFLPQGYRVATVLV